MMSEVEHQEQLFYRLRLNDYIPQDHLLRHVDRFVDFSAFRTELARFTATQAAPQLIPS